MSLKKSIEMFEVILSTAADYKLLEGYKPSRVLFVVDEDERTIRMSHVIRSLVLKLGLKVIIAYPPGLDLSPFLEALSPYVETVENIDGNDKPSKRILSLADEHNVDFIALTMPYPKVEEDVRGGTLEALISSGKYPLLIGRDPKDRERAAVLVAPNPISEKPIKRAVTLAKEKLDVVALNPDDVRKSYCEQLAELLSEKFESSLVPIKKIEEVSHELVVYELKNLGSPVYFRNVFMIVRDFSHGVLHT